MTGDGRGLGHVPAIDGLRALAIVAVVLFHADVPGWNGGYLGVDLFFVISGWLITSLLLDELDRSGTIDVVAFWGRRMRRLLAAVLVLIAVVVVWWWRFGAADQRWSVRADAPYALLYVANWHQIATSGNYWATTGAASPLGHLWSLAIEEQFYVVWPLSLLVVSRLVRRRRFVPVACTVLCVALGVGSFALLRRFYVAESPLRAYMGTDTRASAILVGAMMATRSARRLVAGTLARLGAARHVLMVACIAGLCSFWTLTGISTVPWVLRGGLLLHSFVAAVLVSGVATWQRGPVVVVLATPVLQWVGRRSYSLYLWHWPVDIWFNAERTGLDAGQLFALRTALTIMLAELSYRVVEAPIRWRFVFIEPRRGALAATTATVAVGLVITMTPTPAMLAAPQDFPGVVSQTSGRHAPASPPTGTWPATRILVDEVLWLGDSIASGEAPGVTEALHSAGVTVWDRSFPGQSLTGGMWLASGETWLADIFPHVIAASPGDIVVWQLSRFDAPATFDANVLVHTAFVDMALRDHEAVVLLTPPPVRDGAIPGLNGEGWDTLEDAASVVASRYPGRVFLADTAAVWGTTFEQYGANGVPLRKPDGIHVCPLGSALVGMFLAEWLAAHFDGVTPADPVSWSTHWWTDPRYDKPRGACAPR